MTVDVVAGLILLGDRLLVCQRSAGSAFPLKWEFPGGKVEQGESKAAALRRELSEELNICVTRAHEVFSYRHDYAADRRVALTFFSVGAYRGMPENRVFHRMSWVAIDRLAELDFLEGDIPVIRRIRQRTLRLAVSQEV